MAKTSVLGGSEASNSVVVRNGTVAWEHDGSWEPEWSGHVSISWHWEDFVLHTYGLPCACASNPATCLHQLRVFKLWTATTRRHLIFRTISCKSEGSFKHKTRRGCKSVPYATLPTPTLITRFMFISPLILSCSFI